MQYKWFYQSRNKRIIFGPITQAQILSIYVVGWSKNPQHWRLLRWMVFYWQCIICFFNEIICHASMHSLLPDVYAFAVTVQCFYCLCRLLWYSSQLYFRWHSCKSTIIIRLMFFGFIWFPRPLFMFFCSLSFVVIVRMDSVWFGKVAVSQKYAFKWGVAGVGHYPPLSPWSSVRCHRGEGTVDACVPQLLHRCNSLPVLINAAWS